MGGELVSSRFPADDGSKADSPAPVSYTKIIEEYLPFYLSIGMTYDEYMYKDCCLVKAYRKAHEMKQDRQNQMLWVQGLYFYEALCDVAPVMVAFPKEDAKPLPYRDEPLPRTPEQVRAFKERLAKEEYERNIAKVKGFFNKRK